MALEAPWDSDHGLYVVIRDGRPLAVREYDTDLWATPGGDFDVAPSAVTLVGESGAYTWASPALTADVADWLTNPATNFGWALLGDETADRTAKRFDSRENEPANRPRLTITYVISEEAIFVPLILK